MTPDSRPHPSEPSADHASAGQAQGSSSQHPKTLQVSTNPAAPVENGLTPPADAPPPNGRAEQNDDATAAIASSANTAPLAASPQAPFSSETVSSQNQMQSSAVIEPAAVPTSILSLIIILAIAIMVTGFITGLAWLGVAGSTVALIASLRLMWLYLGTALLELFSGWVRSLTLGLVGLVASMLGLLQVTGLNQQLGIWLQRLNWEAIGALGDFFGAFGQIFIAILAVYIAWRQYVISKDLTIQQNLITQQQTIDSYFQGISELVLDAEGLLEDWPQERAIAEGRTAAILSSVDATGKAKIVRFLSRSRLLTPLRRDRHLGRAMLDGMGGYQEDRDYGIRVIDLGVMLAAANLAGTDLRWTDLSDANLVRANLNDCDLVKANLTRTILYDATLRGADLMGAKLFYGPLATASPRTRVDIPNYETGAFTGTVIENADLTQVRRLSDEQRHYCCAWGGAKTRATVSGGCDNIPNRLGR